MPRRDDKREERRKALAALADSHSVVILHVPRERGNPRVEVYGCRGCAEFLLSDRVVEEARALFESAHPTEKVH